MDASLPVNLNANTNIAPPYFTDPIHAYLRSFYVAPAAPYCYAPACYVCAPA